MPQLAAHLAEPQVNGERHLVEGGILSRVGEERHARVGPPSCPASSSTFRREGDEMTVEQVEPGKGDRCDAAGREGSGGGGGESAEEPGERRVQGPAAEASTRWPSEEAACVKQFE